MVLIIVIVWDMLNQARNFMINGNLFIYLFFICSWLTANEKTVYNKNSYVYIYMLIDVNFQTSGFHFFLCILKASMLLACFNLSCKMSQILGPRDEILCNPWYTVLIGGIVNWEFFLRLQSCTFLCSKSYVTIKRDRSFFILYISVARI